MNIFFLKKHKTIEPTLEKSKSAKLFPVQLNEISIGRHLMSCICKLMRPLHATARRVKEEREPEDQQPTLQLTKLPEIIEENHKTNSNITSISFWDLPSL